MEPEEELTPLPSDHEGDAPATHPSSAELHKVRSLEQTVSLPREVLVVAIIVLAQFLTQVGLTGTLVDIHIISDSFSISNPGIESWLIAGYSLTVGTFILLSGRLGDVYGWKRMLVIGYFWFAIWSLVAGLSVYSNYVLFIFARVFQGIGPAICLPNGLALLGAMYEPGNRKNMAFAVFGACAPVGSLVGGTFFAIFGQLAWWPWAFWSFALVLVVVALGAAFLIPDPQDSRLMPESVREYIEDLDLPAATVGITALVLFNFAWNQAPIVGWHSAYVCVCLVLGVLLVPVFFYLEIKVAPKPLIPFSALNSTNAFVLGCIACGWANFGILVYYLINIIEVLRGSSPLLTCAYLSPFVITGSIAALLTGFLLSKLRPAWLMVIAMAFFLAGNLLLVTVPPHQIYWAQFFVITLVAPFGMDMSFPSATIYLSNTIEKSRQGVAASLVNTIVNYSISLGLGFAGTVEINVNRGGTTWNDTLRGYRGALYMGTGLCGLGLALSIVFVTKTYWDDSKRAKNDITADPEGKPHGS
ncbi:hypothetical protein BAUCODRAFT_144725 [Baudoinia panamericana UAMH 10762]|uniref:Major facilitator superfamily (MFS) profile domain-containing protein n=1 Tax=Baudoinia panamericana (strain UAMH 10762) TaxID=717646 RepID=M2NQ66_BAUPA|nr:uncharacterized protein BAUCODRAFT_144725 [Baudoinia panamericana UAMH 10762]EMD01171.1 hypothetical protein BAUCODRAFT_144725 [Baudoinia panamericana UAMH 10762]